MPPLIARPTVVPFVTAWSGEHLGPESDLTVLLTPEPRLGYKAPRTTDRDAAGALWARMAHSPGTGRPIYDSMHVARQQICMYSMKCQICGQPASRNKDGWLFINWRRPWDPPTWPEGSRTEQPPLCEPHARMSVEQCPHLGRGDYAVLRVRTPRLWGISGTNYQLTADGWRARESNVMVPYGHVGLSAVLASRMIRELRNVTVTDLPK